MLRQLGKQRQRVGGFIGVHHSYGVPDMHDHIVTFLGLRRQRQADDLAHATEVDGGLIAPGLPHDHARRQG